MLSEYAYNLRRRHRRCDFCPRYDQRLAHPPQGRYQEDGKPARALAAGDVVNIPPEVKHWHGAAVDCWFQHLAVEVPAEGASNEWLEFLPTEDYASL